MKTNVTSARLLLAFAGTMIIGGPASAGLRPLLPGEEIVYQTVQSGPSYRTFPSFVSQITGNAYTEYGDEVILGGTNRYITNIAVGTQTFSNPGTPAYMDGVNTTGGQDPVDVGGFLELSIYINDGALDVAGDVPFVDSTPEGMPQPGTLIARSRVPTPTYPQGGVSPDANGLNDLNNPADNALDPWIVEFPFANVEVPANGRITFAMVNLNRFGQPDGHNSDGNQFGVWHATGSTSNVDPDANPATHNNNTTFNTNEVGQSRTGGPPYTFANPGQWTWYEYNGKWESNRAGNNVVEATIYASSVPEPGMVGLLALSGLMLPRRRRRLIATA